MDSDFVFCSGVIGFSALLFAFLLIWRYINYKETLQLAEKGLVKPQKSKKISNFNWMLPIGIIIAVLGLALFLGMLPLGATPMGSGFPLGLGPWLLVGIIPLFFGLSLILVYYVNKKEKLDSPNGEEGEIETGEAEQIDES